MLHQQQLSKNNTSEVVKLCTICMLMVHGMAQCCTWQQLSCVSHSYDRSNACTSIAPGDAPSERKASRTCRTKRLPILQMRSMLSPQEGHCIASAALRMYTQQLEPTDCLLQIASVARFCVELHHSACICKIPWCQVMISVRVSI